ncbi:MAG: 3-hydroxyacyl-CoA dehydrogenase, partial [Burkholderiales bacterium PBB4]
PAMLVLAGEEAPTRTILCAGAGSVEAAHITMTDGVWIGLGPEAPERLQDLLTQVTDRSGELVPQSGSSQGSHEVSRAMAQLT